MRKQLSGSKVRRFGPRIQMHLACSGRTGSLLNGEQPNQQVRRVDPRSTQRHVPSKKNTLPGRKPARKDRIATPVRTQRKRRGQRANRRTTLERQRINQTNGRKTARPDRRVGGRRLPLPTKAARIRRQPSTKRQVAQPGGVPDRGGGNVPQLRGLFVNPAVAGSIAVADTMAEAVDSHMAEAVADTKKVAVGARSIRRFWPPRFLVSPSRDA